MVGVGTRCRAIGAAGEADGFPRIARPTVITVHMADGVRTARGKTSTEVGVLTPIGGAPTEIAARRSPCFGHWRSCSPSGRRTGTEACLMCPLRVIANWADKKRSGDRRYFPVCLIFATPTFADPYSPAKRAAGGGLIGAGTGRSCIPEMPPIPVKRVSRPRPTRSQGRTGSPADRKAVMSAAAPNAATRPDDVVGRPL